MARGKRKKELPGDPNDPEGLHVWSRRYLQWLAVMNYSGRTIENRQRYLGYFIDWADPRSITRPVQVSKPILESYQRALFHHRKKNGKPLSFRAQHSRLVALRGLFKWLTRQNVIPSNPASELELPKLERRLPKHVLTAAEAEQVMMVPDLSEPLGLRNRAVLETLYSTGIRRMEIVHLTVWDIDHERGTLAVRQGKGRRDRMVPIGERAIGWIAKYLDEVRPTLVVPPDEGTLFLTTTGEPLSPRRLTQMVKGCVDEADTGKHGACHLFRHTCATLMLEGGADIRYVQEQLGHVLLSTTQLYTMVGIKQLKAVHAMTHPAAKVVAPGEQDDHGDLEDLLGDLDAENEDG